MYNKKGASDRSAFYLLIVKFIKEFLSFAQDIFCSGQ